MRDIRRWRESELVHGRVAMLASLGFIVGENLEDFPGEALLQTCCHLVHN